MNQIRDAFDEGFALSKLGGPIETAWDRSESRQQSEPDTNISPELLATLRAIEARPFEPSVVSVNAARAYRVIPGAAAVAVRAVDQQGRRVTDFIAIQTSQGLDAVAVAKEIAEALSRPSPEAAKENP